MLSTSEIYVEKKMTGRQQTIILKGIQASSWLIDPLIRSKIKIKKQKRKNTFIYAKVVFCCSFRVSNKRLFITTKLTKYTTKRIFCCYACHVMEM